ncbi:MAG: ABC transporter permease [Halobacteriovoraceae bacterium]|nr:ABC transporter permease [Halobacteriovoraceae bacterium]
MLLKIAFRNVLRQRRRTLLTALMMIGGYVLISFSLALVEGSYSGIINFFTSQDTGHVKIQNKNYPQSELIHDGVNSIKILEQDLLNSKEVDSFAPRFISGALAFIGNKTVGAEVRGLNWEREKKVTNIEKRIEQGQWTTSIGNNEVLIGKKISQILKVNLNDEIVLFSQGADGSMANDIFIIKGICESDGNSIDDYRIYMDMNSAQNFYSSDKIHEYAVKLKNIKDSQHFSKIFFPGKNNIVRPWQEVEKEFFKAMEIDKKGNRISYLIIMLVVSLGILNTVLMSTLERTREFGVMKAIGTTPLHLIFQIILEGQILAVISCFFAFFISFLINFYFQKFGISFAQPISYGGMYMTGMYAQIDLNVFLSPFIIVSLCTFVVSLYPAFRITQISPVVAMREV